jgi:predicted flap endonuclease-1-like 5' DNA nuclease
MKTKSCCNLNYSVNSIPTLYWISLISGLLLSVFLVFITKKRNSSSVSQPTNILKRNAEKPEIRVEKLNDESAEKDDLTIISGIGPVISNFLISQGISSFEKLSKMQPKDLQDLLLQRNLRLNNAETWPHQAKLALSKQWPELKTYINELKIIRK